MYNQNFLDYYPRMELQSLQGGAFLTADYMGRLCPKGVPGWGNIKRRDFMSRSKEKSKEKGKLSSKFSCIKMGFSKYLEETHKMVGSLK